MAITAVQEFLEKVGQDEALQTELAQALEAENDRQAVTELAQSKGYEFSPEELWAEVEKRQAAVGQSGELSDDELEEVAGGATPTIASIAVASAAFGAASAGFTIGQGFGAKVKW